MTDVRCPKCAFLKTRFRVRTQDSICERCGFIWKPVAQPSSQAQEGA